MVSAQTPSGGARSITCDVFCHVIDNFGDAGVCWRLARALSTEEGFSVTLYVDRFPTLARIVEGIRPDPVPQEASGVRVLPWDECLRREPSDVVIETFGCRLPDEFEEAIARRTASGRKVAWLNLEYLSAEDWVEECHGLPSPHPRLPVTKTFLFPGFTRRTGGVTIERGLPAARDAFTPGDRRAFLSSLGAKDPAAPFSLFFFSYPEAPVGQLARALASDARPVQVVAAPGAASRELSDALSSTGARHVVFSPVPAVPQQDFDRLLWCCDALVIRGEDSFVRAQLAQKPFLWTIYPQTEGTHIVKLKAFLGRISPAFGAEDAELWSRANLAWNESSLTPELWAGFRSRIPSLLPGFRRWEEHLESLGSLSHAVAETAKKVLK